VDREADLSQREGVAVGAPGDDPCDPGEGRLSDEQVADTRFVGATPVVDDQDTSALRVSDRSER